MATQKGERTMSQKKTLVETPPSPPVTGLDEPLYTAEEIGAILKVPANTIYKKALTRELPSIKWGKLRRFRLPEVMAALEGCRVEARQRR